MGRHADWPARLNAYVCDVQRNEFAWGRFDCCTFAAGAVQAMTGEDPMAAYRNQYRSRLEAALALRETGSGTLAGTLEGIFGPPVPGAQGRRGDIAWHEGCCGVVMGRFAIFITSQGLGTVVISRLEGAFRVPG